MTRIPRRPAFRPQAESLESRNLMTVFPVNNTNMHGIGSLSWAINEANAHRGPDSIVFQIPRLPGTPLTQVIDQPRGGFPAINGQVTIDGFTQPGSQRNTSTDLFANNTQWGIALRGLNDQPILTVGPGGSHSQIRGLVIWNARNDVQQPGLLVNRANNVQIDGDGFGADQNAILGSAVTIQGGSQDTVGGGVATAPALQNVMITYNTGVQLEAGSKNNAIYGNIIGGDPSHKGPLFIGVNLHPGADNNALVGNALFGNQFAIFDQGLGNVQQGNFVFPPA
jgi:hypothetical protein